MTSLQQGDTNMLENRSFKKTIGVGKHFVTLQSITINRLLSEDNDFMFLITGEED